jgi:hypothetical protein
MGLARAAATILQSSERSYSECSREATVRCGNLAFFRKISRSNREINYDQRLGKRDGLSGHANAEGEPGLKAGTRAAGD